MGKYCTLPSSVYFCRIKTVSIIFKNKIHALHHLKSISIGYDYALVKLFAAVNTCKYSVISYKI